MPRENFMSQKRIDDDVLEVLKTCECDGEKLKMPPLDRSMYVKVNKVLAALGGKWKRAEQAHIFPEEAGPMIADVIAVGHYVDAQKLFQAYNTPPELATNMCRRIDVTKGDYALEPSAGTGVIARALRSQGAEVVCVEIQDKLADELLAADFAVFNDDFLEWPEPAVGPLTDQNGTNHIDERFDVIVMNPPFNRGQDMAHTQRAYDVFLKPGGRMVALTAPGWQFRTDKKAAAFREWLEALDPEIETVAAGTFKSEGTMIRTVMLVLRKPEDADDTANVSDEVVAASSEAAEPSENEPATVSEPVANVSSEAAEPFEEDEDDEWGDGVVDELAEENEQDAFEAMLEEEREAERSSE